MARIEKDKLRLAIFDGCEAGAGDAIASLLHRRGREALADLGVRLASLGHGSDDAGSAIDLLAQSDVLWTRPSDMVFFAALGIPLLMPPATTPLENAARRWTLRRGAGRKWERDMGWEQIAGWLANGTLAEVAWSGYRKLPKRGTFRIAEIVNGAGE
jgi:hypothetical protein